MDMLPFYLLFFSMPFAAGLTVAIVRRRAEWSRSKTMTLAAIPGTVAILLSLIATQDWDGPRLGFAIIGGGTLLSLQFVLGLAGAGFAWRRCHSELGQ